MELDIERSSLFIENEKKFNETHCIPCGNTRTFVKLKSFFDKDEFFEFKRFIVEKKFSPFSRKNYEVRQVLEYILADPHDKSAAYVSLIWEQFQLWESKDFLTTVNDKGLPLMAYVINSEKKPYNIRTLFSFLMFDWHNPHRRNDEIKHFLYVKSEQYQDLTKTSLFSILYETIATKKYQNICLHIIYQFLHELHSNNDSYVLSILPEIMEIGKVSYDADNETTNIFKRDDLDFIKKISKVFVTYWHRLDNDYSWHESRLQSISPFFKLALMLKERKNSSFEKDFQIYIENCKKKYGFYYETKLKGDNRLLLHIAEQNELTQVKSFIFRICPFNEINASPIRNLQEITKLMSLNIYPWNEDEEKLLDNLRKTFVEIQTINSKYYQIIGSESSELFEEIRQISPIYNRVAISKYYYVPSNQKEEHRQLIDEQLKLFCRYLSHTNASHCNYVKRFFGCFKTSRNLLFERKYEEKSLFEEILQTRGMKELIELIWDTCDILKDDNILQTVNINGHHLLDYVIDSNDDVNLIGFIIPNHSNKISLLNKRHLVQIQNEQHILKTGITLFERFMFITHKDLRDRFYEIAFCLLEELDDICDIKKQTEIDKLLLFLDVEKKETKILNNLNNQMMVLSKVQYIINEIKTKPQQKFDYEYDFNKLLRYSLIYWTQFSKDPNFQHYKEQLSSIRNPIFIMSIQIIEGKEDEFAKYFFDNVQELFFHYKNRYDPKVIKRGLIQEDMFFLFRFAIKHGRNHIVECILNYENFETLPFEFPRHNRATKHNLFAARKLLDYGYELSNEGMPPYWITEQVLEDFLNSNITYYDENLVRMDLSFLMKADDRKYKINCKHDVNDYFLFNEHTANLEYILKNEHVKSLLQHPIVSTYINIKTHKYKFIHEVNFYFFLFAFMLPFGSIISLHTSDTNIFSLLHQTLQATCVTSTTIVCIREFFQFKWFYDSRRKYFSQSTNQIELLLIALSVLVLMAIFTLNIPELLDMFSFLSTMFIIVATIVMMTMVPFDVVPLYMRMLKNVSITFLKFFSFFVFIIFAFSVSFYIVFRPHYSDVNGMPLISINDTIQRDGSGDDPSTVYQNFGTLVASFFKTLLMLSGEYTIEPFTLSLTKMIIFFIFVITSFILFNLIIALTITDVKELTDEAEALDLYFKSTKFIESAAKWKAFYTFFGLDNKHPNTKSLSYLQQKTIEAFKFLLFKHCYLHKLDVVFVNLETLEVTIQIKKGYKSSLLTNFGWRQIYKMDARTFESVKQILKKRDDDEFRDLKKG